MGVVRASAALPAALLLLFAATACSVFDGPAPQTRDVLVGNQDVRAWTIRLAYGSGEVLGVYEVPARTRVRISGAPVSREGIYVVALDADCSVVTPAPFGSISTNTTDVAAGAVILPGGDVGSVLVADLAGYPEQPAVRSADCDS